MLKTHSLFILQRTTGIREQIFAIPLTDYCSGWWWPQPAPGTGERPARRRRLRGGEAWRTELLATWGLTFSLKLIRYQHLFRSRSCHGKSEMLFEDICPSHNIINTSHINNNRGKTEKEDVTLSCSNIQVSPKPFSMTGTNNLFIHEDGGFK